VIEEADNKPKAMWKIANEERKTKKGTQCPVILKEEGGLILEDNLAVGNVLNRAFLEKPKKARLLATGITKRKPINKQVMPPGSFLLSPVLPVEVLETIKAMKNSNSCGLDEISTNLLKRNAIHLYEPLASVVNISFRTGRFPQALLTSKIVPVFKNKGERTDKNNYRPIALTSVFSKLLEKLFMKRLRIYIKEAGILSPKQYGFQEGMSTIDAILDAVERIAEGMDEGSGMVTSFLDLTAAFDCVDHHILLTKLQAYGITGIPLKWIASFLHGRKQVVFLNNKMSSDILDTDLGVPQGSVLGPVLYLF